MYTPGTRRRTLRLELYSSNVSTPRNPGSTKPAVEWIVSPRRPHVLLPSILAAMSSGSRMRSWVAARRNCCGWMKMPSFAVKGTPSTIKAADSRTSTDTGWIALSSGCGSTEISPSGEPLRSPRRSASSPRPPSELPVIYQSRSGTSRTAGRLLSPWRQGLGGSTQGGLLPCFRGNTCRPLCQDLPTSP